MLALEWTTTICWWITQWLKLTTIWWSDTQCLGIFSPAMHQGKQPCLAVYNRYLCLVSWIPKLSNSGHWRIVHVVSSRLNKMIITRIIWIALWCHTMVDIRSDYHGKNGIHIFPATSMWENGDFNRCFMVCHRSTNDLDSYDGIIQYQKKHGIIEEVDLLDKPNGQIVHHLVHFPVIWGDRAAMKVKMVFDTKQRTRDEETHKLFAALLGPAAIKNFAQDSPSFSPSQDCHNIGHWKGLPPNRITTGGQWCYMFLLE